VFVGTKGRRIRVVKQFSIYCAAYALNSPTAFVDLLRLDSHNLET